MIHDKTLIEKRFAKALRRYHTMAVVQRGIAEKLSEMIPSINPRITVEIGAGSGFLTQKLIAKFPDTHFIANDITAQSREFLPPEVHFTACDGETMPIPDGTQLIATSSTVQWFDNLPQFIRRAYKSIEINGILAISTFGKENFREIDNTLEYYSESELRQIATKSGFTVVESREWTEQMNFETPMEVLRHIKSTGVNAISATRWTPKQLQQFIADYPRPAVLTFNPIIIILCKTVHTS